MNTTWQFGDFEIQPDFNTITRDGATSQLSPRVMDVLVHLIKNSDRIVPSDELLETFWAGRVVEESTIHRHISKVRIALGDSAKEAKYIKTVSKRGYQAVASIRAVAAIAPAKPEIVEVRGDQPNREIAQTAAYSGIAPDDSCVFISSSHKDNNIVYKEVEWLESQGVKIWHDKEHSPGSNWLSVSGDSLLGSRTLLFFVSERALASDHCKREVSLALDEGITIIPIYLDETELTSDLTVGLSRVQALRLNEQDFRNRLLDTLASERKGITREPVTTPQKSKLPHFMVAGGATLALVVGAVISFSLLNINPLTNAGLTADGELLESIAVLPFTILSERESVGFLGDGLSDSILDELAQIEHLKVASRTTTFQLFEEGLSIEEMGERLRVDYILEGSVQELDGQLRIVTQLIRAKDSSHVLSKTYERPFKDSFTVQRQISRNISQMSHDKIAQDLRKRYPEYFEAFSGVKPEAVSLYYESTEHYALNVLGEGGDLNIAMQLMEKAVEVDPTFIRALSDLGWNYYRRINPDLSMAESSRLAHSAVRRIMALNPDSVDASSLLIQIVLELDLNYASAQASLEQAISTRPSAPWLRSLQGRIAIREGRFKEGMELIKSDATLHADFTEAEFFPLYATLLMYSGSYDEALRYSDLALDLIHQGPQRATVLLTKVDVLLRMNRRAEAQPLLDEAWHAAEGAIPEQFAHIFARTGQPERARKVLESATVTSTNRRDFALGYESLGEIDSVFRLIHDGILDHDRSIIDVMRINVWSDTVRQDPRYLDMLAMLESEETHTPRYLRDRDDRGVQDLQEG